MKQEKISAVMVILLPLVLVLAGCASLSHESADAPRVSDAIANRTSAALRTQLNAIGRARMGSTVALANGNPLMARSATVVDEYRAASGRRCRKVIAVGRQDERLVCQQGSGDWYLVRDLSPRGSSAQQHPASILTNDRPAPRTDKADLNSSAANVGKVSKPLSLGAARAGSSNRSGEAVRSASGVLGEGESLWSFAQRMTGNGFNWTELARFNNIENVRKMEAGTRLDIPPSLSRVP